MGRYDFGTVIVDKREDALRRVWGDEVIDDYIDFLFEYAYRESNYLQLQHACPDEESYKKSRAVLCMARRVEGITKWMEMTKNLREQTQIPYTQLGKRCKISIAPYHRISALIHRRYYPKEDLEKVMERFSPEGVKQIKAHEEDKD